MVVFSLFKVYLCDASDGDGDPMTRVHFVTFHIQSQGVERNSEKRRRLMRYNNKKDQEQKGTLKERQRK